MNGNLLPPLALTALAGLVAAALHGAWAASPPAGSSGIQDQAHAGLIAVPVIEARQQAVAGSFETDGVIEPVRQATVSAQAQGRIASLAVKAGDRVRAGQVLAVIDDREAQTGVARASAQIAEADAQLRNAQANHQRMRDLRAQGFISQAALDTAQAQLRAAQAARDQAGAGARQSALAQGFTRVTAPFDGYVRETLSEAGDLAVPGKPMLTLYSPQPLRAVVLVGASRMDVARAATSVQVQLPAQPLTQAPAPSASVTDGGWVTPASRQALPVADPVSQTVQWRLDLPAAVTGGLLPGQQVRVRFAGAVQPAAARRAPVVVPREAVLRRGELTAVYVAREQGFALQAVRLGADQGATGVEVLAGLAGGERIALDPVRAGLAGARPAQK